MLALIAEQSCKSIEEFKAWSQNLGHDGVLTTLVSYGTVSDNRQRQILQDMEDRKKTRPKVSP